MGVSQEQGLSNAEHERGPTFSEMMTLKVAACTAGHGMEQFQAGTDSASGWLWVYWTFCQST